MRTPSPTSPADDALDLYDRAIGLLAAGDPAQAAHFFERCLDLDPALLDARHGLIRALGDCGQMDRAIAEARRLAELDPDDPLPHTSLSILYQRTGRIAEAEAASLQARLLDWKRALAPEKPGL